MARRRTGPGAAPAPTKIVFYVRVSALMGRSGDDFHSPEMQTDALTRHVEPLGMTVVGTIQDIDVTGQTFTRDGLDQLRAMVEDRQVDAVGLYDLSRLGRDVMESLTFIRWLRDRGVTVLSTKEQIDDSPAGQFMLTQFLALAQLRGDQIGQQWRELIARRADQGIQHGTAPIGYRKVDKRLVVDPVVGPAVTDAFTRYAQGWTISDITQGLNRVRDRRADRRVLKAMFRNEVYRGKVVLHGQVVRDGLHERLVDDETWEQVQARLERDRSTPPQTLAVSHALVGLIRCAVCERSLKRNDEYRKSGDRIARVCCSYAYKMYAPHHCPGIGNPRLDLIEDDTLRQARAYLQQLRTDDAARVEALARRARAHVDEKALRRQLAGVTTALGKLAAKWARDQLTNAEHSAAAAELRAEERDLQQRLGQLAPASAAPAPAEMIAAAETLLELWPAATIPERNMMLRKVVREVHVRAGSYRGEPVEERVRAHFW